MKPEAGYQNEQVYRDYLESIVNRNIDGVKKYLATLNDDESRKEEVLRLIDLEEESICSSHDTRESFADEKTPEAVNAGIDSLEEQRKDPRTFLGQLNLLLGALDESK